MDWSDVLGARNHPRDALKHGLGVSFSETSRSPPLALKSRDPFRFRQGSKVNPQIGSGLKRQPQIGERIRIWVCLVGKNPVLNHIRVEAQAVAVSCF